MIFFILCSTNLQNIVSKRPSFKSIFIVFFFFLSSSPVSYYNDVYIRYGVHEPLLCIICILRKKQINNKRTQWPIGEMMCACVCSLSTRYNCSEAPFINGTRYGLRSIIGNRLNVTVDLMTRVSLYVYL